MLKIEGTEDDHRGRMGGTVTTRAASLCQEQEVTAHFGKPPCRREQRLCYLQVEGLLRGQGLQAALGGALHRRLACILCVREQRGIGRPSLLPLSVQFIRPAQLGVKMLDLRRGKRGQEAESMQLRGQQVPCLFVEGDGIAHGYHPHRLIACCQTEAEDRFRKPRSQGVVCQDRRRCSRRLQHLHRTAVKDGPPRLTCLGVDHCTDLRMCEHVAPISHAPSLALRLLQQMAVQRFVQGRESVLFCEISYLTQVCKGDSLAEDGSCQQQRRGIGREAIEPGHDDFAHTGREEPTHHRLMLHGCCKVNGPSAIFVRVGGEHATLKQKLERFHQIERLPLRFSKEPLPKAFQARRAPRAFATQYLEQAQDVFGGERAKLQAGQRYSAFHSSAPLGKPWEHISLPHTQREEQERRRLALRQAPREVMQHVERGGIGPLHIIDEQDQRRPCRQGLPQAYHRFEQPIACHRLIPCRVWQVGIAIAQFGEQACELRQPQV